MATASGLAVANAAGIRARGADLSAVALAKAEDAGGGAGGPSAAATSRQRVNFIVAQCADRHGVSAGDILGRARTATVVAARHEAIALVNAAFPHFSSTHLGAIFRRHNTTILDALGRTARARAAFARRGEAGE